MHHCRNRSCDRLHHLRAVLTTLAKSAAASALTDEQKAARWLQRIKDVQSKDCDTWYKQAEESYNRYKSADQSGTTKTKAKRRFNIHWSNVQVMKPALYANPPKVNCGRRNKDKNPVALMAAQILERATQFSIDDGGKFDDAVKSARDDYLLSGRGTLWIRYDPTYGPEKTEQTRVKNVPFKGYHDDDGKRYDASTVLEDDLGPYVPGETYKPVVNERVCVEFKHYRDFVHGPASTWDKVPWVAAASPMRQRAMADRFGKKIAAEVEQSREDAARKDGKNAVRDTTDVWEIWDKERGQVRWVCEHYDGFLDEIDDPLGLADFFPCPRPLFGTLCPDSLIPTPDYEQYKDQIIELDRLTDRGLRLAKGIRVSGVYDGSHPELRKLFNDTDEDNYVAVPTWAAFADKGGLESAMDSLPIKERVDALKALYEVRQVAKDDLYEISGISDIMRGDTDPNETKGAQTLKANFGSKRLTERQGDMARFVRDAVAIVSEVLAEHFRPEELVRMSGAQQLGDEQTVMAAIQLLQDQGARDFEIDVETDSTVAVDEQAEKQATVEFVTAVTGYLEKAGAIAQMSPAMMPLLLEMLMFAARRFRAGRDLEQAFEKTVEAVTQEMQQRQANPPPNPEMEKIKMEAQAKQQEMQAKAQAEQQSLQIDAQKGQMDLAIKREELELKRQEMAMKREDMQMQMAMQGQQHEQTLGFEREKHGNDMAMRQQEGAQTMQLKREEMGQQREIAREGNAAKATDGMKVNLDPEMQQRMLDSVSQGQQQSAEAAQAIPQMLAQAIEQLAVVAEKVGASADNLVQATARIEDVMTAPTEIQVDPSTGKKRGVRVPKRRAAN